MEVGRKREEETGVRQRLGMLLLAAGTICLAKPVEAADSEAPPEVFGCSKSLIQRRLTPL
jgi:hypothetical protein